MNSRRNRSNFQIFKNRKGDGTVKIEIFILLVFFIIDCTYSVPSIQGVDANIARNYSDYGIDTNKNGLYEVLALDVGVQVESAGEYSITGYLCDSSNETIWSIDHNNLSKGYHLMHLIFDGKSINKMKSNGRFRITDLTLMPGSSDTTLSVCDYIQNAYVTSAYNFSDFES
jgi:hypothetical protein